MWLNLLAQYSDYETHNQDLYIAGIVVGGVVLIVLSILGYRLLSGASHRQHRLKEAELKVRRDTLMAELREQTACRCPRCGTQTELVRKETLPAAAVTK